MKITFLDAATLGEDISTDLFLSFGEVTVFAGTSAEELDALLGGGRSAQERTAKATEAIVANTKETNRQLKRMKSGTAPATLSYN